MEYYKNILCISYAELTSGDPDAVEEKDRPVLTEASFKYYRSKKLIQVVRRACYGQTVLVSYHSLPDRVKERVIRKFGDPEQRTGQYVLRNMVTRDTNAEQFYKDYTLDDKGFEHLDPVYVELYTANASVLNAVIRLTSDRELFIKSYGRPFFRVWQETSGELNGIQEELGCRLPKNHLSLKRLADRYRSESYIALVSAKFGNRNARKNKLKEQDALIVELIGDGRNIDNETVARLYNAVADRMEWKRITAKTVANYKNEHPEAFAGRHGKKAFANEKLMQVKRSTPTAPMYFWCVDGWDTELLYKSRATDPRMGRSVTTYHHRPTVIAIIDPFNYYIVGYAIGRHESPDLIRAAFRNAFEHTEKLLGGSFQPWQIQSDNYQKKQLFPFMQTLTQHFTPAAVGNAKAKPIEPFFNRFNRKYFRLMPNTSGHGVKSGRAVQVSDDWIESHKKSFPDYAGCCSQIEQVIELDRTTKREAYLQRWNELEADRRRPFDPVQRLLAFGETVTPRKLRGDGMHLQVGNAQFVYDSFDPEFRALGHVDFFLRYDPSDMSRVIAIENIGTQKAPIEGGTRFVLEQKYRQPLALADRREGDAEELARVRQFNQAMVEDTIEKRRQSGEIVREFFDENAERLAGTLTAHVITDSLGRHKDVRNEVAGRKETVALPVQPAAFLGDDDDFDFVTGDREFLNDF